VATGPDWQLVLVDLPGVQRPRDALTARMQRRVEQELDDCDAAMLVLDGSQAIGPGDRFIASAIAGASLPKVVVVNKIDRLNRAETVVALQAASELLPDVDVFPVSARKGAGIGPLVEHLVSVLPEGPFFFEPEQRSDLPEAVAIAEIIREKVLRRTRQELPHAVEVEVDEIEQPRDDLTVIRAFIWVETESQKGIVIGAHGRMIKAIGVAAREELELKFGHRVHLDLSVRVRRKWRADEALLDRLGIG
jgi:GTP-binding protein Era